jgi:hypothetical protein
MTDIASFNLVQDWKELKPLETLQHNLGRLVGKFDYAHPSSEQNQRKYQPRIQKPMDEKNHVDMDTNDFELKIEEFAKTEWPDLLQSPEVTIFQTNTAEVVVDQEDSSTPSSQSSEEEGLIDLKMKEKSVELEDQETDEPPMHTMDTERESIVDRELEWEKENGMEPPSP